MKATEIKNYILNHQLDEELKELYVDEHLLEKQYQRYIQALDKFIELYGDQDVHIFTTSGRSEVGGLVVWLILMTIRDQMTEQPTKKTKQTNN